MIIANFTNNQDVRVAGLDQYDYGQVLRIQGLKLPTAVEIHFGLEETGGTTTTRIGVTKDGVTDVVIPDSMLENGDTSLDYAIYAFVYLTDETSGKTVHRIKMQVKARSKPELLNKPEEKELFQQAIEAVNRSAKEAEGWAHGREDMPERATDNAKYYAESVKGVEQNVKDMVATICGIEQQVQDVKEYAGQAKTAAENALLSEQEAKKSEETSLQHRTGAEVAENNAELAEQNAKKSEQAVEQAKQLVMQMGQEVLQNKNQVDEKVEAFNKVVTDAVDAVGTVKTDAVNAVGTKGTEQAKKVEDEGTKQVGAVNTEAQKHLKAMQEAVNGIVADRQQITQNKEDVTTLKEDFNEILLNDNTIRFNTFINKETENEIDITNTIKWMENKYINSSGKIVDASNFRCSENLIVINQGQTLRVKGTSTTASSFVSQWSKEGVYIKSIHISPSTDYEIFDFKAEEKTYVRISYNSYFTTKDGKSFYASVINNIVPEDKEISEINGRTIVDRLARSRAYGNVLKEKSIFVDGDSIAYGQGNKQMDGTYKSWADYISENNDMILTKKAVSGSTITRGSVSLQDRLSEIIDADYIIISAGYNDYASDIPFGTLSASIGNASDSDTTVDKKAIDVNTFYGGLERIIRNVMINHPNSKLGFVITHKVGNNWINPLGSSKTHTLKEYHDATIEVLEKYSIPYCDMTKYMNVMYNNPLLFTDAQMVHPNELGYKKYYVPHIEAWLKTL